MPARFPAECAFCRRDPQSAPHNNRLRIKPHRRGVDPAVRRPDAGSERPRPPGPQRPPGRHGRRELPQASSTRRQGRTRSGEGSNTKRRQAATMNSTAIQLDRSNRKETERCLTGAPPQPPGFSKASLRRSMTPLKQDCPGPHEQDRGIQERHRRAIDLVIPRRVASPQSPTPFHQTSGTMHDNSRRQQDSAFSENRDPLAVCPLKHGSPTGFPSLPRPRLGLSPPM